ncbi:MAG: IMP dehydrogenase [Bacteroidota bacterium]|jgi:IMP dehydrogenase|nr:IMP dehydrogenase [Sphingobacteriales bacterium]
MINDRSKFFGEGLTFDDVLLLPSYSEVLPRDVNTSTQLTRNIRINIPMLSAAMDTVTESRLAIAMAQQGGVGILHKNMSIERQAEEVRRVKRSESGMILDPVILPMNATLKEAHRLMNDNKIGGIPIVNDQHKLVGILTNRDLRFEKNLKRLVSEIMTKDNLITAPQGTDLKKAELILQKYKIEKLPVVNKQGKLIGLITYKDILKLKDNPNACKDKHGRLLVGAAVGVTAETADRIAALEKAGADVVIIDTAHGHSKGVLTEVKRMKKLFSNLDIVAGNVATGEGAKALVNAGVDAVKVGVGPGSICTTRIIAGIGVPQLTAVYEAAKAIKSSGVPVIADGGIRYSGDVVKALAAGASTVMSGGIFAGTEESPGETIIYEGRKFKSYRGMGSIEAMKEGSKDRYFQDAEEEISKLVPEGIVGMVAFKGNLKDVIYQFVGGLRAGMGYLGAKDIKALQRAKFIKITGAGAKESHAHDITITKEAPNYSKK